MAADRPPLTLQPLACQEPRPSPLPLTCSLPSACCRGSSVLAVGAGRLNQAAPGGLSEVACRRGLEVGDVGLQDGPGEPHLGASR